MRYAVCDKCGARVNDYKVKTPKNCKNCGHNSITFTSDIRAYYGYFLDKKELRTSSSGGAATILAKSFIACTGGGSRC